MIFIAHKV